MARRPLDPYVVLGVGREASRQEVARAHRRLAKRHHPDLNPGSEAAARMRRINEAWRILSSPTRRARYDRAHPTGAGTAGRHWASTAPPASASWNAAAGAWATSPRDGGWSAGAAYPGAVPRPDAAWTSRGARATPRSPEAETRRFAETGWAALLAAALLVAIAVAATYAGSATRAVPL
jgi:curved DNA-binding protein CbpA